MNAALPSIRDRLSEVRDRIMLAAKRSGRGSEAVLLVGVVKSVPVEWVREALAAGLTDVAENRIQEAETKLAALGRGPIRWHLVGHLQRNKAGRAAGLFDRIHSVDSLELARMLSTRCGAAGLTLPTMLQVNIGGETNKHGVAPEAVIETLRESMRLPALAFDGLMSIGPVVAQAEDSRRFFARTRELRDEAERTLGVRLPHLSMGMSGDYEVAIEEGSTMVRIGSTLFGPRR